MMEITINIKAPELAEALHALAKAMKPATKTDPRPESVYAMPETPIAPPPIQQAAQPIAQPPMQAAPIAPPPQVPVTEPDYSHEQLGRAAAAYMDKAPGNQAQLIALLQQFGVQAITHLNTPQKRTAFANALRGLGATV